VLGGFLFGAVMIAAFGIAIEAVPPRRIMPLGLGVATLLAFAIAGTVHISRDYLANAEIYAPREAIVLYDQQQWAEGSWASLPLRRIDLAGRSEEAFSLQWAGDLSPLGEALAKHGWTEEGKWSWTLGLAYLDPHRSLSDLTPRPALHQGRLADITWTKPIANSQDQRLVLRAWKTDVMIGKSDKAYQVYVVSLMRERLRRGLNFYAVPSPLYPAPAELEEFSSLARSIPDVGIVPAKGLAAKDGPILVDAMK
jgi:hypothetical protein